MKKLILLPIILLISVPSAHGMGWFGKKTEVPMTDKPLTRSPEHQAQLDLETALYKGDYDKLSSLINKDNVSKRLRIIYDRQTPLEVVLKSNLENKLKIADLLLKAGASKADLDREVLRQLSEKARRERNAAFLKWLTDNRIITTPTSTARPIAKPIVRPAVPSAQGQ